MKIQNTLVKAIALLATLALTSVAQAQLAGPAWTCDLKVENMHGWTVAAGKAFSLARGTGNVHCETINGETSDTAVKVHILGAGVGLGVAHFKNLDMKVAAVGLTSVNDIFGTLILEKKISLTVFKHSYSAGSYISFNRLGASVGVEFSKYNAFGLAVGAMIEGILITPVQAENTNLEYLD